MIMASGGTCQRDVILMIVSDRLHRTVRLRPLIVLDNSILILVDANVYMISESFTTTSPAIAWDIGPSDNAPLAIRHTIDRRYSQPPADASKNSV